MKSVVIVDDLNRLAPLHKEVGQRHKVVWLVWSSFCPHPMAFGTWNAFSAGAHPRTSPVIVWWCSKEQQKINNVNIVYKSTEWNGMPFISKERNKVLSPLTGKWLRLICYSVGCRFRRRGVLLFYCRREAVTLGIRLRIDAKPAPWQRCHKTRQSRQIRSHIGSSWCPNSYLLRNVQSKDSQHHFSGFNSDFLVTFHSYLEAK